MEQIPLKYKDIEEAKWKKYPDNAGKRYAFVNGAMWVIEKLFPEKSREELFDELEMPKITLD